MSLELNDRIELEALADKWETRCAQLADTTGGPAAERNDRYARAHVFSTCAQHLRAKLRQLDGR